MVCGVLVMIERLCTKYEFTLKRMISKQENRNVIIIQIYNSNAIFEDIKQDLGYHDSVRSWAEKLLACQTKQ